MPAKSQEINDDVKVVITPTADAPPQPPSDTFHAMIAKVNQGMKEWEESRFKSTQEPNETKTQDGKTADQPEKKVPETATPAKPAAVPGLQSKPDSQPAAVVSPEPGAVGTDKQPETGGDKGEAEKAEEVLIPPAIKTQKAADEFRNLKRVMQEKIKEKQAEILGLQKQIQQTQAKPVGPDPSKLVEQIQQLQSEREQLLAQIEKSNLEASPRFKAKYQRAFAEIESTAKSAAGDQFGEKIVGLLQMPPSKYRKDALNQIMAELEPVDQTAIGIAFANMDRIRSERDSELSNFKEIAQQEQAAQVAAQAHQEQLTQAKREFLLQEVLKVAGEYDAFKHVEGDDAHNTEAETYKREISEYINGQVDETYSAFLPVLAAEGQYLKTKKVPALETKIKELEATIGELTGANPKVPGTTKEKTVPAKPKSFIEAFTETWTGPRMGA